jgi:hypothetical protein
LAAGPDTFRVIEQQKGTVRLAEEYRYSGARSVRLSAVTGDPGFPELQGYVPVQRTGTLHFHFALLLTNPGEELNIALAGPAHFTKQMNGLGFWLTTRKGRLMQWSAGELKDLAELRPFVWYVVDCLYRIGAGKFDLTVRSELDREPLVMLRDQPNVMGLEESSIDRWSFVSNPFAPDSNVSYYFDDVELTSTDAAQMPPVVAPGRRQLFVDRWNDARREQSQHPGCLPVTDPSDLGNSEAARRAWDDGCAAARIDDRKGALSKFGEALRLAPQARMYPVSVVLGLMSAGRVQDAVAEWTAIEPAWRGDWRHLLVSAWIGIAREDLETAKSLLEPTAWKDGVAGLPLAEQYLAVLLWRGDWTQAETFARRIVAALPEEWKDQRGQWMEYSGDASFFAGAFDLAKADYEAALQSGRWTASLRLADIAWKQGDTARERELREYVYGRLGGR